MSDRETPPPAVLARREPDTASGNAGKAEQARRVAGVGHARVEDLEFIIGADRVDVASAPDAWETVLPEERRGATPAL